MKRSAFFISDSTGITAEMLGNSLLSQFEGILFDVHTIPYIDTIQHAEATVERINRAAQADQAPPIVFDTIVDPGIRGVIATSEGLVLDVFGMFLGPLTQALQSEPTTNVGKSHGLTSRSAYQHRMEAIHYALDSDDGAIRSDYEKADLILLGVSRSGKTPTCLYLALQYGINAANYPLTDEDLDNIQLPRAVRPYRSKLFGLTIDPQRLSAIRKIRKADSNYASIRRCEDEVRMAQALFKRYRVPQLNTTSYSIEEIATRILLQMGIERRGDGCY
jgi:regulator of PEP synthase PpsR (kinase-PPPase family)